MKRRILSTLLIAVMATSVLSGCGGKGNSTKTTKSDNAGSLEYEGIAMTDEDVELTVWESTAGADEFVKQAGEAFSEKYPNIKIKYVNVELGDSSGQIALDGPAGVGPDLFAIPSNAVGSLSQQGHILASQQEDVLKERLIKSSADAVTSDGTMYGYPISADTYALFYNRDLIKDEEVPKTFADVITWSKDFQAANAGKQGFLMNPSYYYAFMFCSKNDNFPFGADGTDESQPNCNTKDSVDGMTEFAKLREIVDAPAADLDASQCDGAFSSGNAAMYVTGLWNVSNFTDAGINFGVTTLPALDGTDHPAYSMSNARDMVVSAYSTHPNEAAAFGLFMTSDEMQQLRFELTGALPSTDIEVDADYIQGFTDQLKYAFPTPSISKMDEMWTPMDSATANIWDGADPQKELDAAQKTVQGN